MSDSRRVIGECWRPVGPQPSFEETLVGFDHFCTSTVSSKMERPGRAEIVGCHLFCGPSKGFTRVFGY
jgi:hypothetical protein